MTNTQTEAMTNTQTQADKIAALKDRLVGFVTKYKGYALLVVIAAVYFLFLAKKL